MRPKRAGLDRGRFPVRALCLVLAASAALGAPAAADTGPLGTDVSPTEYMLVLDAQWAPAEIDANLADAEFTATERIAGLPPRYGNYRLIQVASADAETKAELLAVDGILAVRPLYRVQGLDYPILSVGQVVVRFEAGTTRGQVDTIAISLTD